MSTSHNESFDFSRRRLCPDGACVGLLDESGRCKECGLVAGAARAADPGAPSLAVPQEDDRDEADERPAPISAEEAPAAFDPGRRLCPDGSCVGVLGAGDRCSVCGRGPEE